MDKPMAGTGVLRYSNGAIVLHWLLALLLAGEIALGFAMPKDISGFALYQLHKSIGITILLLSVLRLAWRLTHRLPEKAEGGRIGFLASAVHVLFYFFMIAAPLTGWAVVSTASVEVPTLLFGMVPWPHLPLPGVWNEGAEELHEFLAYLGLALFILHVAGALRHHFLLREPLLARMGPGGSARAALALTLAVPIFGLAVLQEVGQDGGAGRRTVAQPAPLGADGTAAVGVRATASEEGLGGDAPTGHANGDAANESQGLDAAAGESQNTGPQSWVIRPGGSLRFTIDYADTLLSGAFRRWGGTIAMDPYNPQTARIAIEIDLASATLGDATQDQMLQGASFFATSSYPKATYDSNSVRRTGTNAYRAEGTLVLKGASRSQHIEFTLSGSGNKRSVIGGGIIDRMAFAIGTGPDAADLGADVRVDFSFDATTTAD